MNDVVEPTGFKPWSMVPVQTALPYKLIAVARRLMSLAARTLGDAPFEPPCGRTSEDLIALMTAENILADRRRREKYFKPNYFGEPAWDLLLTLYIRYLRAEEITVQEACAAMLGASTSTGMRWLSFLVDEGLVIKVPDAADSRKHNVQLTRTGLDKMRALLDDLTPHEF